MDDSKRIAIQRKFLVEQSGPARDWHLSEERHKNETLNHLASDPWMTPTIALQTLLGIDTERATRKASSTDSFPDHAEELFFIFGNHNPYTNGFVDSLGSFDELTLQASEATPSGVSLEKWESYRQDYRILCQRLMGFNPDTAIAETKTTTKARQRERHQDCFVANCWTLRLSTYARLFLGQSQVYDFNQASNLTWRTELRITKMLHELSLHGVDLDTGRPPIDMNQARDLAERLHGAKLDSLHIETEFIIGRIAGIQNDADRFFEAIANRSGKPDSCITSAQTKRKEFSWKNLENASVANDQKAKLITKSAFMKRVKNRNSRFKELFPTRKNSHLARALPHLP